MIALDVIATGMAYASLKDTAPFGFNRSNIDLVLLTRPSGSLRATRWSRPLSGCEAGIRVPRVGGFAFSTFPECITPVIRPGLFI